MNTQKIFNGKSFRLAVLALAALAGLVMNDQAVEVLESIFRWFWDGNTLDDAVLKWLKLVVVGLPVFLALWVFRTSDTRQQIEKTQAQIEQSNFATGMQNLISGEPMQVEIGVQILLGVSKNTSEFDANIRLALIKRLKEFPSSVDKVNGINKSNFKLSYAQHIIKWLKDNSKPGSLDLNYLDLTYQNFTSTDVDIKFSDIHDLHDSNKYSGNLEIIMGGCDISDVDYFFKGYEKICKEYMEGNSKIKIDALVKRSKRMPFLPV